MLISSLVVIKEIGGYLHTKKIVGSFLGQRITTFKNYSNELNLTLRRMVFVWSKGCVYPVAAITPGVFFYFPNLNYTI